MANIQPVSLNDPSARSKINDAIVEANKVEDKANQSALDSEIAARTSATAKASQSEATAGSDNTVLMTPLRVKQWWDSVKAGKADQSALAAETAAREAATAKASLAEAQDGSSNDVLMTPVRTTSHFGSRAADNATATAGTDNTRWMSALRVKQAFDAHIASVLATLAGKADASAVAKADVPQAQDGDVNDVLMTPLRTSQHYNIRAADKSTAEGGVDTSKWLSALRVKQAFDAHIAPVLTSLGAKADASSVVKADTAEAQAGSSGAVIMTPAGATQHLDARRADQATAEAGTDNTKWLSPLRAKQLFNALIAPVSATLGNKADTSALSALSTTVDAKANTSALSSLSTTVDAKADATALATLATTVDGKADATALPAGQTAHLARYPGRTPALYSTEGGKSSGTAAAVPSEGYTLETLTGLGEVMTLSGSQRVTTADSVLVEPNRYYRAVVVLARTADVADPAGAGSIIEIDYFDGAGAKQGATVALETVALTVDTSPWRRTFIVSTHPAGSLEAMQADVVAPAGAAKFSVFVNNPTNDGALHLVALGVDSAPDEDAGLVQSVLDRVNIAIDEAETATDNAEAAAAQAAMNQGDIAATAAVSGSTITLTVPDGTTVADGATLRAALPEAPGGTPQIVVKTAGGGVLVSALPVTDTTGDASSLGANLYSFRYETAGSGRFVAAGNVATNAAARARLTAARSRLNATLVRTNATQTEKARFAYTSGGQIIWRFPATPAEYPLGVTVSASVSGGSPTTATVHQKTAAAGSISGLGAEAMVRSTGRLSYSITELDAATGMLEVRIYGGDGLEVGTPSLTSRQFEPILDGQFHADPDLAVVENFLLTEGEKPNVITTVTAETNQVVNAGGPATVSGHAVTVPDGGTVGGMGIDVTGLADPSDTLYGIVHMSRMPTANLVVSGTAGLPGDLQGASTITYIGGGLFAFSIPAATAGSPNGGLPLTKVSVALDHRHAPEGSGDVTATLMYLAVNATRPPVWLKAPAAVQRALSDVGVSVAHVDPSAPAGGSGSRAAPFQTVSDAVRSGATTIMLRAGSGRAGYHRSNEFAAASQLRLKAYREGADTNRHAHLIGSAAAIAEGDWSPVGGSYPNLYSVAMATNPARVYEVGAAGVETSMGVIAANGKRFGPAADLAVANATEGAWHWVGGTLYVRPFGDTLTGKTWETPSSQSLLTIGNGARVEAEQVHFRFARQNVVDVGAGSLTSKECVFSGGGYNNIDLADGAAWDDLRSLVTDSGNDGCGTSPSVRGCDIRLIGTLFDKNNSDGLAPHGVNNRVTLLNVTFTDNGKQGFVTIGPGTYRLTNVKSLGNYDVDILVLMGAETDPTDFEAWGVVSGQLSLTQDDPSLLSARLSDVQGPVQLRATASVKGHRCRGQNGTALRVQAGTAVVEDFHYAKNGAGAVLTDGALTLRQGHVLRNATGVEQTGGTLTLDSDDPVNVFGNDTQFSGVSGADQAKTLAVTAV